MIYKQYGEENGRKILSGLNARYMGVSTKAIAFRNFVFSFNAIRCLWIVIIADVMEMFMYLFGLQTATVWCSVVSIVTFMYFTNMVYDLMSKKSKIYLKIWKKLGEMEINYRRGYVRE